MNPIAETAPMAGGIPTERRHGCAGLRFLVSGDRPSEYDSVVRHSPGRPGAPQSWMRRMGCWIPLPDPWRCVSSCVMRGATRFRRSARSSRGRRGGDVLFEGATSSDGSVSVRLPAAALVDIQQVTAFSGDRRIAALAVAQSRRPASISIVSGGSQVVEPGQTLADPLVVEVWDAAGEPVPGAVVRFTVSEGTVSPRRRQRMRMAGSRSSWARSVGLPRPVIRIESGNAIRDIRYSPLSGGRSVAEIEADLDEADRLLAAGDVAAARALYDDVEQVDPLNSRATLGHSGRHSPPVSPRRRPAGPRAVLRRQPEDATAWLDLADARSASETRMRPGSRTNR